MTMTALRNLSRRIAVETFEGKPTAQTDKALVRLFEERFNRFRPRGRSTWNPAGWKKYTTVALWLAEDEYVELRRRLLLSGAKSLRAFVVRRLGLSTTPRNPAPRRKGN